MNEHEKSVVARCIADLLDAGFCLTVYDGEEYAVTDSRDANTVMDAMGTTDEDRIYVRLFPISRKVGFHGWVNFIYGNSASEVISDNTVNMESVLKRTFELCDNLEEKGL